MRGDEAPLSDAELELAIQHGLAPRLYESVPKLRPVLEQRFRENLSRSLLLTSELGRLLDALPPALAFKGPVLAQRLYGDIAAREYCDLDLLLRPADVPAAITALEGMGFVASLLLEPWQLHAHLRSGCEYVMSDGRIHVELHWQIAPRQFGAIFDINSLFSRSTGVRISDRDLPALSPEDDLLALVVHGTKHAWSKLAWVTDVAALLRTCSLDWSYVRSRAHKMHISRMLHLACDLAAWVGTPLPVEMRVALNGDKKAQGLMREVTAYLELGALEKDEWRQRIIFGTRDSGTALVAYLLRQAFTPTLVDWNFVRLPRGARWLYPAARLLRLVARNK